MSTVIKKDADAGLTESPLSGFDINLIRQGRHYMLYKHMGAQYRKSKGGAGVFFSVWVPNAMQVSVIGDFNQWTRNRHNMQVRWDGSGIWELWIPDLNPGDLYKFHIEAAQGFSVEKADPFAYSAELPPNTASRIVAPGTFKWSDKRWLNTRAASDMKRLPMSVYELHPGSWRRIPEENNRYLSYREMAAWLPAYCKDMGFTHVELMPIMEHPFYGSWGYQVTGYFAPTARYGTPDDFKYLVNELHRHQIGVILDWVPAHFPGDAHALFQFDGSHLYEHADPREGFHQDWQSYIFNYGRNEVKSFLISNALFWLLEYHIDGLRVDAVASMLYRDYSREAGAWIPNIYGGRENLEAISFIKDLNAAVHEHAPGAITIAEESTAFPGVTRPVEEGGLGFDFKWMMGWMHDTLRYFQRDTLYRRFHQQELPFSMHYVYSESFMLPLSHDEVVHGKGALLDKMPGDDWQKAANLRSMYAYMYGHPGAKLLFMGGEFGQQKEWNHESSLDWHLLQHDFHKGMQSLVRRLNKLYCTNAAMYELSYQAEGFAWIDYSDHENSVFSWIRRSSEPGKYLLFILNAQPKVHQTYRLGVPEERTFNECLNTDDQEFGGSGFATKKQIMAEPIPMHGLPCSIDLAIPPLAVLVLEPQQLNFNTRKKSQSR
jgi:1,4-alpha-glucan branching enzyme